MTTSIRKYGFVCSPFLLGLYLVFLLISSFYVEVGTIKDQWIPAIISFVNIDLISEHFSNAIALLFLFLTSASLYFFNEKVLTIGDKGVLLPILYLIITLISPKAIFFSGASVAAFLIVWSLYFTLYSKNGEKEFFLSGFFISLAAIFEPLIVWMIPFVIFFAFNNKVFTFRGLIVILLSVILPFIFLLSFRYLIFQDALVFAEIFLDDIVNIEIGGFVQKKIADYALFFILALLILSSFLYALKNINRSKILKAMSFNRIFTMFLSGMVIILLYPSVRDYFSPVISIPISILLLQLISSREELVMQRIIFLIFLIFLAISRIAEFL